jgi:hypothetical protein
MDGTILFNLLTLISDLWIGFLDFLTKNPTLILGITGFIITGYYSKHTKKIADEKMMKELFTEFNKRYADLNDYLVEIEHDYHDLEIEELEKVHKYTAPEHGKLLKKKVIDYFSLCAEEFYWFHHKKRIDPLIWKSWQSGMNYWYNEVPTIKRLWKKEVEANEKKSYYIIGETEFFIDKK